MNINSTDNKGALVLLMGFAGCGKLTVAQQLVTQANFRIIDNHLINNPVLSIIKQDGVTPLPRTVWDQIAKIRNIILDVLANVSPHDFNFVITAELINDNAYASEFFNKIVNIAAIRNNILMPVRLICDEVELINRVQSPQRIKLYKSIDPLRSSTQCNNQEVFISGHINELTINNTNLTPNSVADLILEAIKNKSGEI